MIQPAIVTLAILEEARLTGYLKDRVVLVVGDATDEHRAVAVALAEAGADVAVGGPVNDATTAEVPLEFTLHSIANEIWALGRKSAVAAFPSPDETGYEFVLNQVIAELGRLDLVVHCDVVAGFGGRA